MKKVQDMKLFYLLALLVAISFGCSSNDASNPTNRDQAVVALLEV